MGAATRIAGIAAPTLALLLTPCVTVAGATAQPVVPASVAGLYDGGQTEIAARLQLFEDGRFRYSLSYGALDEGSYGTWTRDGGTIVLTSDPVIAPAFAYLGSHPNSSDELTVDLDLPDSLPRSLFGAVITLENGTSHAVDFGQDGLAIPLAQAGKISTIRLTLPIYDVLGEPVPVVAGGGNHLRFAFQPNALGFVAFNRTPLPNEGGAFVLERHGRILKFRKTQD